MSLVLIIWMLASIGFQFLLNWISRKIKYDYGKKREILAIVLNAVIWSLIYYKAVHPFVEAGKSIPLSPIFFAIISTVLISITFIDFKYYEIPNSYNAFIALMGILYIIQMPNKDVLWSNYVLGGVIAFIAFFVIAIFTGGNLGMGDVKLVGGLGFFVGKALILKFFMITFLSGALISLFLLIMKIKKKEDKIAFGPYICFAFIWMIIS